VQGRLGPWYIWVMAKHPANHLIHVQPAMVPGTCWRVRRWALVTPNIPPHAVGVGFSQYPTLWSTYSALPQDTCRRVAEKGAVLRVRERTAYEPYIGVPGSAPVVTLNGATWLLVENLRAAFEPVKS
jgi:hypothetical protein